MYQSTTGQILGASVALAGGAAVLPNTGNEPLTMVLSFASIATGSIVLISFIVTRVLKRVI